MATDVKAHLKHEFLVGGISNTIFNGLIAWGSCNQASSQGCWNLLPAYHNSGPSLAT